MMLLRIRNNLRKNVYLFTLAKVLAFSGIILSLDAGIGGILRFLYFRQYTGIEYQTIYSINHTTADLLIFGSSRATHQYYPELFENNLNLSYYNVGRDGTSIFYHYAVLKAVLERYTPKMVILDFEADEFALIQESYDRLSCLLPFYRTHPEIRPIVRSKSKFERIKLLSSIYPFNSSVFTIVAGNSKFYVKLNENDKGYIPLLKMWNKPIGVNSDMPSSKLDENKISTYESFIKECVNSKIQLYVVCPPFYIKRLYQNPSVTLGKKIAGQYNVPFLDYSNDTTFINNPSLYADIVHFNNEGAKMFSGVLIKDILIQDGQMTPSLNKK
jgi:hypothetical protein